MLEQDWDILLTLVKENGWAQDNEDTVKTLQGKEVKKTTNNVLKAAVFSQKSEVFSSRGGMSPPAPWSLTGEPDSFGDEERNVWNER